MLDSIITPWADLLLHLHTNMISRYHIFSWRYHHHEHEEDEDEKYSEEENAYNKDDHEDDDDDNNDNEDDDDDDEDDGWWWWCSLAGQHDGQPWVDNMMMGYPPSDPLWWVTWWW